MKAALVVEPSEEAFNKWLQEMAKQQ